MFICACILSYTSIILLNSMGDCVGNVVEFASQLRLLVDALAMSLDVQFMEDFVSGQLRFLVDLFEK